MTQRTEPMLTPQDDLPGHQTPGTFAQAGNDDLRFTERWWYTAHPTDGRPLLIDVGFGYYPNRGVMDAFAGVTVGRRQHNFRASRRLGQNPLDLEVGPLRLDITPAKGLHRLRLQDNASGLAFELEFEASLPAAQEKQSRRERDGVLEEDLARVTQFGRWRGWLQVNGERPELASADWRGQGRPYCLSGAEFQRRADGGVSRREITGVDHDLQWADDPLGQTLAGGELRLSFDHGAPRVLRLEPLPTRFYLKGGLYGGFGGWNHGEDKGAYAEAHDAWDLDDPLTRERARTLGDHVMRVHTDGESGIGISEYGVAAGYSKYPGPQKHPAL